MIVTYNKISVSNKINLNTKGSKKVHGIKYKNDEYIYAIALIKIR